MAQRKDVACISQPTWPISSPSDISIPSETIAKFSVAGACAPSRWLNIGVLPFLSAMLRRDSTDVI